MLNEYISAQSIDTYIPNFNFMTTDDLSDFLKAHELSFTLEEFIYIQNYFKNTVKAFPTYNQLSFFDQLNKIRKAQKSDYKIYSASASEGADEILESSKDLLAKRSVINKKSFGAMPISFAAEISAEYLKHLGYSNDFSAFIPVESIPASEYHINTNDGIPLFAYCESSEKNAQTSNPNFSNTSFVMLCPLREMEYSEYTSLINEFLSHPEISSIISEQNVVSAEYGIYDILRKETNGILVNISTIPETKKNEYGKAIYLTSLLSEYIGRYIFTTSNTKLSLINQIATSYELCACVFATRNYSKKFTLEAINNPAFSFDFDFLNTISSFKDHHDYLFTKETDSPIGAKEAIFLTSYKNATKQIYRADRVLNFGKTIASATSREISSSPHKTAALAVLDATNALIAKGVAKSTITLAVNYSLLGGTDDNIELGKNLAAILGVYRSTIELYIPQIKPKISYNKAKRTITVVASAKAPKRPIESSFKNGDSNVYFLPIAFLKNELPDYEKYRKLISRFYQLIENDSVLSSFAINENLLQTVKSASKSTEFDFFEQFDKKAFSSAHGILFESYEMLHCDENLFFVGNTRKRETQE